MREKENILGETISWQMQEKSKQIISDEHLKKVRLSRKSLNAWRSYAF